MTDSVLFVMNLWGVGVVKHAEDDPGHGVLGVGHVARWGEGGQVVLQGLAEHAVKGDVGTKNVTLLPAVFLQLLNLSPKAVQVLEERRYDPFTQTKTNITVSKQQALVNMRP